MKLTRLGRYKAYAVRSQGYISLVNTIMLLSLVIERVKDAKDWHFSWVWYFLLIPIGICGILVVGFLDTKSGIRKAESLDNELNRPVLMEMRKNLKEIKDKLE